MHAPTYVDREKNIGVKSRCFVLTYVQTRSIIKEVGCLPTKGGCCDYNGGIFDSRGGVSRTENDSLHRQGDATRRRNTGIQVRYEVAHQKRRVRGVEKAETTQTVSGKLNSSSV